MSFGKYTIGITVMATIPQNVADNVQHPGYKAAYTALVKKPLSGVICKVKLHTRREHNQYESLGVRFNLQHRDGGEQEVTIPINSVNILEEEEISSS